MPPDPCPSNQGKIIHLIFPGYHRYDQPGHAQVVKLRGFTTWA
jgi:hypothetical protein